MMKNPLAAPANAVFAQRHSPYQIDPDRDVSSEDLRALFEAARWTMSASNLQPWRYIVGVKSRHEQTWQQVFDSLLSGNQSWAQFAPVLALGIYQSTIPSSGKPNTTAMHDLGAASGFLTIEATHRDLIVHQMAGVDRDKAHEIFGLDDDLAVLTALAIGYPGENPQLPENYAQRDARERVRKPVDELIIAGGL